MNVFKHELRQNWGATAIWIGSILLITAIYTSIFPTFSNSVDIDKLMESFPDAYKKAFGLKGGASMSSFSGFYTVVLSLVTLTGSVQAANLGIGLISKEVRLKTADFLLAKPITRNSILIQKILSALLILIVTNGFFIAGTWVVMQLVVEKPLTLEVFIMSTLTLFLVQSFFFSLGLLLGTAISKVRSVIGVSLPLVFGFYILTFLDTVMGEENIRYLTPFKFFDIGSLVEGGDYSASSLIYFSVLFLSFLAASFLVYRRKDVQAI